MKKLKVLFGAFLWVSSILSRKIKALSTRIRECWNWNEFGVVVLILFFPLHRALKTNSMKRFTALFQVRFPGQPNSRPAYLNQMTHLFHLVWLTWWEQLYIFKKPWWQYDGIPIFGTSCIGEIENVGNFSLMIWKIRGKIIFFDTGNSLSLGLNCLKLRETEVSLCCWFSSPSFLR